MAGTYYIVADGSYAGDEEIYQLQVEVTAVYDTEIDCGDEPSLQTYGWYCGNADGWTHIVAELAPNAFGLYDLHGNVWEWCNDWYHNTYEDEEINPIGPPPGWYKVLRGGGWSDVARRCRSASRRNPSPHKGINGRHGFRYVISVG